MYSASRANNGDQSRILDTENLKQDTTFGYVFPSHVIDPPAFLLLLQSELRDFGCRFVRHKLNHISEALSFDQHGSVDAVFNCTGLGSRHLRGVEDADVYGEVSYPVTVEAPWLEGCAVKIGTKESGYVARGNGSAAIPYMDHAYMGEPQAQLLSVQ